MDKDIRKIGGANMDIDLNTGDRTVWEQGECPWNEAEATTIHKCAIKDVSLCPYFCGVEYMDTILCSYPGESR